MHRYFDVIKKYAVFEGRASRSEYWYFILFNFLISFTLFLAWALTKYIVFDILYQKVPQYSAHNRRFGGW
jgi:uncharacterized membrane protein YhaH (DUF805 family)